MAWIPYLLTLVISSCIMGVQARTSGPPEGVCDSMFPAGHGPDAQSSDPPFEIIVDDTEFQPGQTLTVTIRSTGATQFKGFFIQARKELTPLERVGTLNLGDSDTQQFIACDNSDGVGHNPPLAMRSEITLSWTAPDPAPESNIFFRATLVEDYNTFWVGVDSDIIIDLTADQLATAPPPTTPLPFTGTIDLSGCGITKGCFIESDRCGESENELVITWSPPANDNETRVYFEMRGKTDGWLGLGFSLDDEMGNDYVLMCVQDGDTAAVAQSYNDGRYNGPFSDSSFGISGVAVSNVDGEVTCVFDREIDDSTLSGSNDDFLTLDTAYTLFLGTGPVHLGLTTQFEGSIDFSSCGDSKGCYIEKEGCGSNNEMAVSWTPLAGNGETFVHFEMRGETDGWLGLGFSRDDKMGSDYVLMCVKDGDTATIVQSYTEGLSNSPFSDSSFGISNPMTSYVDGVVTCVFDREIDDATLDGSDSEFVELDRMYTLFLGTGSGNPNSLSKHDCTPLISDSKIDVTKDTDTVDSDPIDYIMFQLHAIFMITAWMFLISLSLILARFYKPAFPEKKICGVAIWFALHRFLNIVAVALTIAAFIIIFVEVEGFTEIGEDSGDDLLDADVLESHSIHGIIVTVLVIINPIMSIFRPGPDHSRRPVFNWAHWIVGTVAHLASFVAIFIGFSMPKSRAFIEDADREWVRWVFVAFAAWHLVFYLVLEVLRCYSDNKKKEKRLKYEMEMQPAGATDQSNSSGKSSFMAQYSLLFIYSCGGFAALIAIIYGIASADTD